MSEKPYVVIGLTGEIGSGKGVFCRLLEEMAGDIRIARVSTGAFLMNCLRTWGIHLTRANAQELAITMDRSFGEGALSNAIGALVAEAAPEADAVIYDAVRWMHDVRLVRSFPRSLLVYVTAPSETRYQHAKARGNPGDHEMTADYEAFLAAHEVMTEMLIPVIGNSADFKIDNTGTLDGMRDRVREFLYTKLKPALQ